MTTARVTFSPVHLSLSDLAGNDYTEAVCHARACLTGQAASSLLALAARRIDLFPQDFCERLAALLPDVGKQVAAPLSASPRGATSVRTARSFNRDAAPLAGLGCFRIGEDGRLYLVSKGEHYHAVLGHGFPGHQLIDTARQLGIPNATHNNTRGTLTRLLEEELVRVANGIQPGHGRKLARALSSRRPFVLNRVLNLQTGSLAVEAGLKLILSRFYRAERDSPGPKYHGRIPVLLVVGDDDGGLGANYHGTTIVAQMLRGMWPDWLQAMEQHQQLLVRSVRPNDEAGLTQLFDTYDREPHKIAGFLHELVLMNYGARTLTQSFVTRAYALCEKHDVPVLVDEIQTCAWSPAQFMFLEYGVKPRIVAVGKGFPNGEFAGSRVLFSSDLDVLPQFGALVTNGQEELTSLAYLITMRWVEANADAIRGVGDYYQERLRDLAARYPSRIRGIDGSRHLAGVSFHDVTAARKFAAALNRAGVDISVQTYKQVCPPSALTKLPLVVGPEVVDWLSARMREALDNL